MSKDTNIYPNMSALSREKEIPLAHLKAAKALNCRGYTAGGRWNYAEFEPWYQANMESVLEYVDDNQKGGNVWKQRKERAQALIAEIELKEREGKTLDKDKVIAFLKQVGGSQAIVLRNMAQELPHRLLGKNITEIGVILSKSYDEACGIFNGSLDKWNKK